MKYLNQKTQYKRSLILCLFTTILLFLAACSQKQVFKTSAIVPEATGYVTISKNNQKNYIVKIELTNLEDVNKLATTANAYVVWLVSENEITKNIGQLKSSSLQDSPNLKVTFETVSTIKPTKIFITAEADGNVQYYGNRIILSTNQF